MKMVISCFQCNKQITFQIPFDASERDKWINFIPNLCPHCASNLQEQYKAKDPKTKNFRQRYYRHKTAENL